MSGSKSPKAARAIVEDVLSAGMTREIWTANYQKALPVTIDDFDLAGVLPAVIYMFRFGYRRGKGSFQKTFAGDAKGRATIENVADGLSKVDSLRGFEGEVERAVLGDLLLCLCLENRNRERGRREQVQRVAPAHYMASWLDLPKEVANLRFVPEMIVALLANQDGEHVELSPEGEKSRFPVGRGFDKNVLLTAFNQSMKRKDHAPDYFDEKANVGLDQLLMIRLAQKLDQAPDKVRKHKKEDGERISNQRPVAEFAARAFSEDLRRFIKGYANEIPRLAFVELLESCMSVGLTTIVTGTIDILLEWSETGVITKKCEQRPPLLLVDCSNGMDKKLRSAAEQSLDDLVRRIERFPTVLMALRLLDHYARFNGKLSKLDLPTRPYAADWINLLGDLLKGRRPEATMIHGQVEMKANELAEALGEESPDAAELLRDDSAQPNPVWRMAEALTLLQGRKNTQNNVMSLLDSSLLLNRPNGLATRRSVQRMDGSEGRLRRWDVRSLVFTDPVLDYLVHRHVLSTGGKEGFRRLSFHDFLTLLRDRHGFCVEVSPPNLPVSNDLLRGNRAVLERRLRDLGLLVGVNDAESMKYLRPRFEAPEAGNDVD